MARAASEPYYDVSPRNHASYGVVVLVFCAVGDGHLRADPAGDTRRSAARAALGVIQAVGVTSAA